MRHEEREALRGLGKEAWFIYVNGKTLDSIRLVALLDALDELEASYRSATWGGETQVNLSAYKRVAADRDRYKARAEAAEARAEALERAIAGDCAYCNKEACKLPCGCINCGFWRFDQARFTEGGERDG